MATIDPVPLDGLDPKTAQAVDSFYRLGAGNTAFPLVLAHVPGYLQAIWGAMAEALFEGAVDHQLKELMRIQLATTAGDAYFSNLRSTKAIESGMTEDRIAAAMGDFENDPQFNDAEKWALRYAYLMYRRPDEIDRSFYDAGRLHFTEAQIMEMGGLVAIHYGLSVFMGTLSAD